MVKKPVSIDLGKADVVSILGVRYSRSFFEAIAAAKQAGIVAAAKDADGAIRIVVQEDSGDVRPARMPRGTSGSEFFTAEEWFLFPIALRERWWRETDYGKRAPSSELLQSIKESKR